jgi:hypothetical protein
MLIGIRKYEKVKKKKEKKDMNSIVQRSGAWQTRPEFLHAARFVQKSS